MTGYALDRTFSTRPGSIRERTRGWKRQGSCLTPLGRFMEKVERLPNGCWQWTGSKNRTHYPTVGRHGRSYLAHRLIFEWLRGPIPAGLELDHLCRNRGCVNPDHLEAVTQAENARRARVTHCKWGHPMVGENVIERPNRKGRQCRACDARRQREYQSRLMTRGNVA